MGVGQAGVDIPKALLPTGGRGIKALRLGMKLAFEGSFEKGRGGVVPGLFLWRTPHRLHPPFPGILGWRAMGKSLYIGR